MKILVFIFAIYIVLLPALPCLDRADTMSQTIETNMGTASHQDDPHSDEACNPFCICSCCGQTITSVIHFAKQTTERFVTSSDKTILYNSVILSSGHFGNIWQPPRIS